MSSRTKYRLTPEHRAQLKPWAERWTANALSTKPMDDEDRAAMRVAIAGLYRAASLEPPSPERIVFVPSPLAGALAAGLASAVWAMRAATRDATKAVTEASALGALWDKVGTVVRTIIDATAATVAAASTSDIATLNSTKASIEDATWKATIGAIEAAVRNVTSAVTKAAAWAPVWSPSSWNARLDATWSRTVMPAARWNETATEAGTRAAMSDAMKSAMVTDLAERFGISREIATQHLGGVWQGADPGNHGGSVVAFLSFFRHVVKLDLPEYDRWQHYEAAAVHGSWRWMHPKFCIVADRPRILRMDDRNRPHCADGPSHQWSDGWQLWHWHGVRVPRDVIETPATITAERIKAERNQEVRRAMLERVGPEKALKLIGARKAHKDQYGTLYREPGWGRDRYAVVMVENGTSRKRHYLSVPASCRTALEAIAWTCGMTPDEYRRRIERRT